MVDCVDRLILPPEFVMQAKFPSGADEFRQCLYLHVAGAFLAATALPGGGYDESAGCTEVLPHGVGDADTSMSPRTRVPPAGTPTPDVALVWSTALHMRIEAWQAA